MTHQWQELKKEQKKHKIELYIFVVFSVLGLMMIQTWSAPMIALFILAVIIQGIVVDVERQQIQKKETKVKKEVQEMPTTKEVLKSVKIVRGNLDFPKVKTFDIYGKEKELSAQIVKYKGIEIKMETYQLPEGMLTEAEKLQWLVHPVIYVPEEKVIDQRKKQI